MAGGAATMMLYTPWHSDPTASGAADGRQHLAWLPPFVGAPTITPGAQGAHHRPAYAVRSVQGRRSYQEDSFDVRIDLLGSQGPGGGALPRSGALPQQQLDAQPWHASCGASTPNDALLAAEPPLFHFAAVFDGHGGSAVAQHCAERLAPILRNHLLRRSHSSGSSSDGDSPSGSPCTTDGGATPTTATATSSTGLSSPAAQRLGSGVSSVQDDLFSEALARSFADCDACIPQQLASEGGSTAVCAVLGPDCIWVANCGDSRAMVARRGALAVALSDDHKPDRPDETERIKAAGGHVFWNGGHRVMGVLSMTRAMGDQYLKQYGVICTPEVMRVERTPEDEFLLLASDGLWASLSNAEAVGVAAACIERAQARGADRPAALRVAAQVLVKAALQQGSSDNITVVLVDLLRPSSTDPTTTTTYTTTTATASAATTAALPMPTLLIPPSARPADAAAAEQPPQEQQQVELQAQVQVTLLPPPTQRQQLQQPAPELASGPEQRPADAAPTAGSDTQQPLHKEGVPISAQGGSLEAFKVQRGDSAAVHCEYRIHATMEMTPSRSPSPSPSPRQLEEDTTRPAAPPAAHSEQQPEEQGAEQQQQQQGGGEQQVGSGGGDASMVSPLDDLSASPLTGALVITTPPPSLTHQDKLPHTRVPSSSGVVGQGMTRLDLQQLTLCGNRTLEGLAGGNSHLAAFPFLANAAASAANLLPTTYTYPNLHPWLSYHAAASAMAATAAAMPSSATGAWGSTLVSTGAASPCHALPQHPHTAPVLPSVTTTTEATITATPAAPPPVSSPAAPRARRRSDGGLFATPLLPPAAGTASPPTSASAGQLPSFHQQPPPPQQQQVGPLGKRASPTEPLTDVSATPCYVPLANHPLVAHLQQHVHVVGALLRHPQLARVAAEVADGEALMLMACESPSKRSRLSEPPMSPHVESEASPSPGPNSSRP